MDGRRAGTAARRGLDDDGRAQVARLRCELLCVPAPIIGHDRPVPGHPRPGSAAAAARDDTSTAAPASHHDRELGRGSDKIFKTREPVGNDIGRMSTMITPRLVVPDPDAAIAFYRAALEADLVARFELDDGSVTHAELVVDGASFSLTAEVAAWGMLSPASVRGSPTLVTLTVPDAPRVAEQMVEHGAIVTVPIEDRPYGRCEGRVQDPFGHLWILSHVTEQLSDAEIRDRLRGISPPQPVPAEAGAASVRRIVPDLPLVDHEGSMDFYVNHLSLRLAMDLEWVMNFVSPAAEDVQMILIRDDLTAPVRPVATIEVADVDRVHDRLVESGFRVVHPLTTERWGVRRFFVEDPNGNVINVLSHVV